MKNKEIEELLNKLKDEDNYIEEYGYNYKRIALDDCWLLSSYIEQLKNRNKELYEGFMATQEELCNNFDDMNIFTNFELERMLGEIDD